ncbi:MAG: NADH:flavin oxidoreductase [Thermoguttaceae bacterium]|nr:NADH:flavin oxidoreductase [Thermoguttaceae bacterium]MDW8077275.1 NADH:flavin oxidoreductase [Thermoguttaceae bacterium]
MSEYPKIASFRSVEAFWDHFTGLAQEHFGWTLPIERSALAAHQDSPLAEALGVGDRVIGNRFCIHPMEGWDGTLAGLPSERTLRRWRHFGLSGAKLIWGGEAVAVRHDGRANPNQLCYRPENRDGFLTLLRTVREAHQERFGRDACEDLLVGLQLTHSGRFSRPNRKDLPEPRIVYHHPLLDSRVGIRPGNDAPVLTDDELLRLVDDYVAAAKLAQEVGFDFVDIKACHGYLGHETLSAYDRPGPFGGNFENRVRWLCMVIEAVQSQCPGLLVGVRLSVFDFPPFRPDPARSEPGKPGPGVPCDFSTPYPCFGARRDQPLCVDLTEPIALMRLLRDRYGIRLFNLTAGSPYYNPHIQRPAYFPPSDAYAPPEDPLLGCLRQIDAVRQIKLALPDVVCVGSAYTYLQEYLPHVGQAVLRAGWADAIGLGRMVLSYWDLPADVLAGRPLDPKRICRTFSDCTTAPRNGLPSGCYPLDDFYKNSPEAELLKAIKMAARRG